MDKYEISLWEDYPVEFVLPDNTTKRILKERKIAVIGSDTIKAQARALEPNLIEELNGSNTFTFKMYYTYTDNATGEQYKNPFEKYLVNERKIKVYWKDKWYDFVIKKCQEDTSKKSVTYTCKDLYINELSKQGYSLEFSTDLQNNIGTVEELAKSVLKGSTWRYDEENSTPIIQRTEGPLYEVRAQKEFTAINQDKNDAQITISLNRIFYVFYDSVVDLLDSQNKNCSVQFLYSVNGYKTDINDVLITNADCCQVDLIINRNGDFLEGKIDSDIVFSIDINSGVSNYRGERLVRSQLTEFDPLLNRYVLVCKDIDYGKKVYEINTTEYSNPVNVINLVANPSEFTSTAGWVGAVDTFGLFPKFTKNTNLKDYTAKSYLKVGNSSGKTSLYNSCIQSNLFYFKPTDIEIKKGIIGGIQKNEKYIFRVKFKTNNNNEPSSDYSSYYSFNPNVYKYNKKTLNKIEDSGIFDVVQGNKVDNWVEWELTCKTSVSANEIENYGLFIDPNNVYWIEEVQFFKYELGLKSYDAIEPTRINPGEFNFQSYASPVFKYYYANNNATTAEELTYLYIYKEKWFAYEPVYNNYEKVITIEEKESNRFNILQSIAETAQAWVKFRIEHDDTGAIAIDENGQPKKYIYFVQEIGNDTGISFEYGIDLKTITRTIDSDKLATKIIVNPNSNEFAPNGFCSIARSDQNYTRDNFILNLDYFTQQNLIDKEELDKDLYSVSSNSIGYYYYLHNLNKEYDRISNVLVVKNSDKTKQESQLYVYQQYLSSAREELESIESEAMGLAGVDKWEDIATYLAGEGANDDKVQSLVAAHSQTKDEIKKYSQMYDKIEESLNALTEYINQLEDQQQNEETGIITKINEINKTFNDKYTNYIMEGTWQDDQYVDANKYYLDALKVAYTSSRPQLSYNINVLRLSSLEDFSSKVFNLGDICYMQDREFFGYLTDGITPYKEKILVSKVSSFFDQPEKDVLTVQNYKTRFDDLFQRIAAATQSLTYSEGSFARAAAAVNADGSISYTALQDAFDYNENLVFTSSNQDVKWDESGITVTNKLNSADKTKIIAGGIFVTNDGGNTWKNAVRGDGISADVITTGRLNTGAVYIYNGDTPSFRWDATGINAYAQEEYSKGTGTNFGKFVRFDKYGVYGYDGGTNFVPNSEGDIWDKCRFGLTWSGFFLKSTGSGGTFEISTSHDLLVKDNKGKTRIQIGRLVDNDYGMIVNNYDERNNLVTVFEVNNTSAKIAGWNINKDSLESTLEDGPKIKINASGDIGCYGHDKYTISENVYTVKATNNIDAIGMTSDNLKINANNTFYIFIPQLGKTQVEYEVSGKVDKDPGLPNGLKPTPPKEIQVVYKDPSDNKEKNYKIQNIAWTVTAHASSPNYQKNQDGVYCTLFTYTFTFTAKNSRGTVLFEIPYNASPASSTKNRYVPAADTKWSITKNGDSIFHQIIADGGSIAGWWIDDKKIYRTADGTQNGTITTQLNSQGSASKGGSKYTIVTDSLYADSAKIGGVLIQDGRINGYDIAEIAAAAQVASQYSNHTHVVTFPSYAVALQGTTYQHVHEQRGTFTGRTTGPS